MARGKRKTSEQAQAVKNMSQFSLFDKPGEPDPHPGQTDEKLDYDILTETGELNALSALLSKSPFFSLDLETTGLDPLLNHIVGISVSWQEGKATYIPVGHRQGKNLPIGQVFKSLQESLSSGSIIYHNAKFDYQFLKQAGDGLEPAVFSDTMVLAYILDPENPVGLKACARRYLDEQMTQLKDLPWESEGDFDFSKLAPEDGYRYACADADMTLRLYNKLYPEIIRKNLKEVYEIDMPLVKILAGIELKGVGMDRNYLEKNVRDLSERVERLSHGLWEKMGVRIDLDSPDQVAHVFFKKMGLAPTSVSKKTGKPSTSAAALEDAAAENPAVRQFLLYRQLSKLKNGFFEAMMPHIHPKTGRIHCNWLQCRVPTGRIACRDFNFQSLPRAGEDIFAFDEEVFDFSVRRSVVPEKGYFLIGADYSQIELRIAASESGEKALLEAFQRGEDIHVKTAAMVLEKSRESVTKEERQTAKAINFGLIYGMQPKRLAAQLKISEEKAGELSRVYFQKLPYLSAWIQKTQNQVLRDGFVKTHYGRVRYLPAAVQNEWMKAKLSRESVNTFVQGTAADILRISILRLSEKIKPFAARIILLVHDEIILEVNSEENIPAMLDAVSESMELSIPRYCALPVKLSAGFSWGDMSEIVKTSSGYIVKETGEPVAAFLKRRVFQADPVLFVDGTLLAAAELNQLKELLLTFPGNSAVYLRVSEKVIDLGPGYRVKPERDLLQKLEKEFQEKIKLSLTDPSPVFNTGSG